MKKSEEKEKWRHWVDTNDYAIIFFCFIISMSRDLPHYPNMKNIMCSAVAQFFLKQRAAVSAKSSKNFHLSRNRKDLFRSDCWLSALTLPHISHAVPWVTNEPFLSASSRGNMARRWPMCKSFLSRVFPSSISCAGTEQQIFQHTRLWNCERELNQRFDNTITKGRRQTIGKILSSSN